MWHLFCHCLVFSSLLLSVSRKGCASLLRHCLGIFTYTQQYFNKMVLKVTVNYPSQKWNSLPNLINSLNLGKNLGSKAFCINGLIYGVSERVAANRKWFDNVRQRPFEHAGAQLLIRSARKSASLLVKWLANYQTFYKRTVTTLIRLLGCALGRIWTFLLRVLWLH